MIPKARTNVSNYLNLFPIDNLALEGGVIYCENCINVTFFNSKFILNGADKGGVFSIKNN